MARSRTKKKLNQKAKRNRTSLIIVMVIAFAILGVLLFMAFGSLPVESGNQDEVIVTIEEGTGAYAIGDMLKEKDLIRSNTCFKVMTKVFGYGDSYKAGTYAFTKGMSMERIINMLIDGETAGTSFTITEGQTIDKVADQLEAEGIINKEEFYYEVEHGQFDYSFMSQLPQGATRLEGFLFPETYQIPLDATAHDVVDIMLKGFEQSMYANGLYDEVEADGRSLYTIITEASIVQREAGSAEEYANVASVIDNRLAIDMPLQMDSIIAYIQKEDKIRATYSDIAVESDYNPYTNKGLPPGPICAPGLAAIQAVLHPADTDYLYFVASDKMDGTNVYSKTYEDFLVNKAKFDKAYEEYIKEHPDEE